MHADIVALRAFYRSRLGDVTHGLIQNRIAAAWADSPGDEILGLGYALPYLRALQTEGRNVIGLMPAGMGAVRWPEAGANLAGLVDDEDLPLANGSMEGIFLAHCLEHSADPNALLRELWRVLAPGGRMLIVVPNRRGMWARAERTPFGHGQPFSWGQLRKALRDNSFEPTKWHGALYTPPSQGRMAVRMLEAVEPWGNRLWRNFCGVIIVEAQKQMFVGAATTRPNKRAIPLLVPATPNSASP